MTPTESLAVIAIVVSVIGVLATIGGIVHQSSRNKNQDIEHHEARLTALETKVGLFWGLVEDHMSKFLLTANPVEFTDNEKAAAVAYDKRKAESPTYVLRTLESALSRELKVKKEELPRDEMFALTLVLAAIKAQLVDRGEQVYK